jgi:MerR family copper efflux transcriptional regulator
VAALTIGQLARRAGVGIETVRFYERQGLLPKPPRTPSGYRQYSPEALGRLAFIGRAKGLGFALREIAELLALEASPEATCDDVKVKAQGKLTEIETQLANLTRVRDTLRGLVGDCHGGPASTCPVLRNLKGEATGG